MKKVGLVFFSVLVLLSLGYAQQDPLLPPDSGQTTMIIEPPENVGAPPISPQWQARRSWYYTGMVVGNFDGDAYEEIAFDYGASGIWIYDPNASPQWNQISTDDPVWMISVTLSSTADDELIAEFSTGTPNRWWNYSGYPGTWKGISGSTISWAYDAGNIGDGDAGHEFVAYFPGYGVYVLDYTGSGPYGDFEIHKIHNVVTTYSQGMPIDLDGNSEYELIHYFDDGLYYWNYASGYPATWTLLNTNFFEIVDCYAVDVDGGADEFIGDTYSGLWQYKHGSPGTWTRINYSPILEAWPCAYDTLGEQYEVTFSFSPDVGLWEWNGGADWARINWTVPQFAVSADIASAANGGNSGEEMIADFGSAGVWIQYLWRGAWTRLNWNNPVSMVPANLDSDPQYEIVFNFGSLGVWRFDQATGAWTRLNWNPPESN